MEKILEELYLTIKTIKDNIIFLEPILNNNISQTNIKITNTEWALKRAQEITNIIKSCQANNTLNEEELAKITEEIIEKLIQSGQAEMLNENKIKLKMSASPISKKNIDKLIREMQSIERRNELIYQNSLINLVTTYERAMAKIITTYYVKNNESLGPDKTIKLYEVKKMNSISEIVNYLIMNEVKDLMHRGVKEWHDFIKKKFCSPLYYYNNNRKVIEEIFERRNLFIHNDGIINEIYYNKFKDDNDIHIGQKRNASKDYIFDSANILLHDYIDIVLSFIDYNNRALIETLFTIGFEEMCEKNYLIAYEIFSFLDNNDNEIEANKCLYKINKWICCKSISDLNGYLREIDEYDYSNQSVELQLGIEAIKMDKERIRALVNKVNISQLSDEEISTWPVFQWIREDEDFYAEILKLIRDKLTFQKDDFAPISR